MTMTMDAVGAFLDAQDLDKETKAYLVSALEDGGAEDFCEVAESFLPPEAVAALQAMVRPPAASSAQTTATAPKAKPAPLRVGGGVSLQDLADAPSAAEEVLQLGEGDGQHGQHAETSHPSKQHNKQEKRLAKSKAKAKGKAKAEVVSKAEEEGDRDLQDVAAFGLAETEEGLDAFDSFAVCWGREGRKRINNAEASRDINLPTVYIGIVTELGQKDLITCASLQIMRGHKYGLIGRNGCGKTTLLRRIARRQLPGLPELRYGYVAQELVGTEESVLDTACSGDVEYQVLKRQLTVIEKGLAAGDADAARLAELTEDFAAVTQRLDEVEEFFGKEGLKGHARDVLLGLQFTPEMLDLPTRALSGGWRMRVALAQALLSRADCLLLDEPTNHLDFAGVLWLQSFLKKRLNPDCMLVLISHDRSFLDDVVTDIIEIRRQNIEQGPGNYSSWQQRRAEEREAAASKVEANERERERTKEMVQRLRQSAVSGKKGKEADANKLRQAKQREEWLHGKISSSGEAKTYGRLELVNFQGRLCDVKDLVEDKLSDEATIKFRLPEPEQLRGNLLQLDGASFTITEVNRTILRDVQLSLEPHSRVAVVGTNGAGKTTLLRWLEGEQWPNNRAHRHPKLKVAHVSQHHLERLEDHLGETCVDWIRGVLPPLDPGQDPNTTLSNVAKDEFLFAYLANFGLGSVAKQKLGTLSGGQKARLAFSGEVWHRPHLLLLDEPTNHLDIETLEALAEALKAFPGAAVIVSHNQSFLQDVCNELWIVDAGRLTCTGKGAGGFENEFSAYRRKVLRRLAAGT